MELPVSLKEETKKTGKEMKNGIYFSRLQKCLDISKRSWRISKKNGTIGHLPDFPVFYFKFVTSA